MKKLTRRRFFKQTSIGVATVGVLGAGLAAVPRLTAIAAPAGTSAANTSSAALSEPLVAYVRNPATGEVGLLVGSREIVYRDPDLVSHLLKAAYPLS